MKITLKSRIISTLLSLVLALAAAPALDASEQFDFSSLEKTPIQEGGRKKPYFTFSVEALQSLTGKTSFSVEGSNVGSSAMAVITSIWFQPDSWLARPLILLNYRPLKEKLGLNNQRKFFSYTELTANPALQGMIASTRKAEAMDQHAKLTSEQKQVQDLAQRISVFESIASGSLFTFVPNAEKENGRWLTSDAVTSAYPGVAGEKVAGAFVALFQAYQKGDRSGFTQYSKDFSRSLAQLKPEFYPSGKLMTLETFYMKVHPFRWAWVFYLLAAVTLGLTWIAAREIGYRLGWTFVGAGFAMQIFGFVCRVIISGRAPVTNMYESVVWVAFGSVLFAIILESIYRCRYYLLAASSAAVVPLILADTQTSILNSAIHPLTPVLRDNFWLSTHVTSITLSYAAFLLALAVGHIILIMILARRHVSGALYNYLYRSIQIGVLLLATGTILGGVWANYSWGRFWDWDPKETWALIALLGYIFLLHGRIAGWWGGFGLAVGSVLAFQSVLMAWYGVNFVLGVGLHSYGFGTGGFPYVAAFSTVEIILTVAAIVTFNSRKTRAHDDGDLTAQKDLEPAGLR